MAFIAGNNGSGTPPGSSSVASTSGSGGQDSSQQQQPQINFSHLMALMQQQQQQQQQNQQQLQHSAAAVAAPSPLASITIPSQQQQPQSQQSQQQGSSLTAANQAALYQQLLLQQQLHQQHQQQQQQQQAAVSQQTQSANSSNAYLQQLQQLAAQLQQPQAQSAAVTQAIPSVPQMHLNALLQNAGVTSQPQIPSAGQQQTGGGNNATAALLLALQQQQQQQQVQQQQAQQQINPTVALLTNMLSQFPQSTLQQVAPLISLLANQNTQAQAQSAAAAAAAVAHPPSQVPQVSATQLMYPTPISQHQAAALSQQQHQHQAQQHQQQHQMQATDENKALLEYLLRQQQEHQHQQLHAALVAAATASASSVNHTPRGSLSTQNSSGSLVGQQQQQAAAGPIQQHQQQQQSSQRSSSEAVYVSIPPSTSTTATSSSVVNLPSAEAIGALPPQSLCSRQTSSERLLSSGQSIEDHISKLISENAAIVEPNPVLLKRRPYNRQNTSGSLTSQTGGGGGNGNGNDPNQTNSAQGSPGLRSPGISQNQQPPILLPTNINTINNIRIPTTRSQSMHEPAMLNTLRLAAAGSLTSGQPIIRNHICPRCNLKFPNEVGLNQHQDRCGGVGGSGIDAFNKKDFLLKQHSTPQLNLNTLKLHQHQQQIQQQPTPQQILLQQQKLQAEHQARISALIGGGAGVAPDSFMMHHIGGGGGGRNSVPSVNPSPPLSSTQAQQQFGGMVGVSNNGPSSSSNNTPSRKTSFQPVPLESRSHSKKRLLENIKPEDYIDVVTINDSSRPNSTSSNNGNAAATSSSNNGDIAPTKMARIQAPIAIRPTPVTTIFSPHQSECQPSTSEIILPPPPPSSTSSTSALLLTLQNSQPPQITPNSSRALSQLNDGELSPESKSVREMVQLQLAFMERGTEPRPYIITIKDQDIPPIVDNDVNAAVNRRMLRTLTNCSKVCEPMPHYKIFGSHESQFALYSQSVASEEHVTQLFQYLACYSLKPKINEKPHCKYTIASNSSILAHPTHSSTIPPMTISSGALKLPKVEVLIPKPEPKHVAFDIATTTTTTTVHQIEPIASSSKIIIIKSEPEKPLTTTITPKPKISSAAEKFFSTNNTEELIGQKQSFPGAEYAAVAAKIKPISGSRNEEVEVYVRGRGRGRYVCDRCGIKCKKPSMLKKHLKSHTNIRPFNCITCNFSFKTKGNLTKHLFSKTHRRKMEEVKNGNDNEEGRGLQIVDNDDENDGIMSAENQIQSDKIDKRIRMESIFVNEPDNNDADDEDEDYTPAPESLTHNDINITYRSFGQENIIYERDTHTPPTWWTLCKNGEESQTWEKPDLSRSCHSAPPVVDFGKPQEIITAAASGVTVAVINQALPQIEPNIGILALQQITKDGNASKFVESVSRGDHEAQMQLTSEVIRMTRGDSSLLPIIKTQEILKPIARKRTYTGTVVIDPPVLSAFMAKDNFNCDQCSRKFRKESELNLHKQTHLIEKQQNAKSKSCQCPECKVQLRSRALLQKHMETAHADVEMAFNDPATPPSHIPSSSGVSLLATGVTNGSNILNGFLTTSSINSSQIIGTSLPTNNTTMAGIDLAPTRSLSISNGRSFICVDCGLGFRSHGVLAKHLRTKNHVRQLCTLGKLPDDAMTIIRDNSSALTGVDASDCDSARTSLIAIINRLRPGGSGSSSLPENNFQADLNNPQKPLPPPQTPSSLECMEQLSAVSPTPRNPESNFRERGSSQTIIPRTHNNQNNKRNIVDESGGEYSSLILTPRKQSRLIFSSATTTSNNSPSSSPTFNFNNGNLNNINGSNFNLGISNKSKQQQLWNNIQNHDLATTTNTNNTASTTSSNSNLISMISTNGGQTYSISEVWIPPKAEDLDINNTRFINNSLIDASSTSLTNIKNGGLATSNNNINNNGFDENTTSDATTTSRSETSTPQQKNSFSLINNNSSLQNLPTTIPPMTTTTILNSTKCQMCEISFDSPNELQIHFQSEHISIRDGSYFSCPNNNCGKVYPSKESLKNHLLIHYRTTITTPGNNGNNSILTNNNSFLNSSSSSANNNINNNDLDEFAPAINQSAMSPSDLLNNGGAASPSVTNRKSSKTAHTAPKHSPGAPEESHTISGVVVIKQEPNSTNGNVKKELPKTTLSPVPVSSQVQSKNNSIFGFDQNLILDSQNNENTQESLLEEFGNYYKDIRIHSSKLSKDYWRIAQYKFPNAYKLFLHFLNIPATSGSVECFFSKLALHSGGHKCNSTSAYLKRKCMLSFNDDRIKF